MNFPKINKITTVDITEISREATLCEAIDLMFRSEHRYIIVTDHKHYYGLSIFDVLSISQTHMSKQIPLTELTLTSVPTLNKHKSILDALELIRNDHEYIVVVNDDDSLYGLVTQTDILSSIDPDTMMETFKLADLLKIKKRTPWIGQEMRTAEVFRIMEQHCYDAVMIVENKKPKGIITAKDILLLLKKHVDLSLPVKEYMITPVITISNESTLKEALEFMQNKHFKRLVATDSHGDLIGSITQKELISIAYTRWVKMIESYQSELQKINEQLENKSQKYEKYAGTDSLTGLYNRMKFLEIFVAEYTVMMQRHNYLSLLVLDIDHFKSINDNYGHNMGDKVLKEVANLLKKQLRSVDIVCRWGGEEFVVLLPAAEIEEACQIAEKIRNNISRLTFQHLEGIYLTVSIGVTQIKENDELQEVIERADQALYLAKRSGRNCVRKNL